MSWNRAGLRWLVPMGVTLGVALRLYHYLRGPSVWHDEAALLLSVIHLSFAEALGSLPNAEAAPPLFLVAERAALLCLGDGIFAMRLIPFLASCLSLLLFAGLARRVLGPAAAGLALGLFAVSDRLLWHACEAKPYALDVLIATAAGWWFVASERQALWRRCLPMAIVAPFAVWMSYPACFVGGGLLLALLPSALRRDVGWHGRASYALFGVALCGAFLALALGPASAQRCQEMDLCWVRHFPDWQRPWIVPLWALTGTFEVARYALMPLGQAALVFATGGVVLAWRGSFEGKERVIALWSPLLLALVAALLRKYPYGGSRLEVFAAPAICLFAAAGARHWLPRIAALSRPAAGIALVLLLLPFGQTFFRTALPWSRAACDEAAELVREAKQPGERILVNTWEYEYYFRNEPGTWRRWDLILSPGDLPDDAQRVWVLLTREPPFPEFPCPLPAGWSVGQQWGLRSTTVFRLDHVKRPQASPVKERIPVEQVSKEAGGTAITLTE